MTNSNAATGNRTCDLPVSSAVPRPTAPLRATTSQLGIPKFHRIHHKSIWLSRRMPFILLSEHFNQLVDYSEALAPSEQTCMFMSTPLAKSTWWL